MLKFLVLIVVAAAGSIWLGIYAADRYLKSREKARREFVKMPKVGTGRSCSLSTRREPSSLAAAELKSETEVTSQPGRATGSIDEVSSTSAVMGPKLERKVRGSSAPAVCPADTDNTRSRIPYRPLSWDRLKAVAAATRSSQRLDCRLGWRSRHLHRNSNLIPYPNVIRGHLCQLVRPARSLRRAIVTGSEDRISAQTGAAADSLSRYRGCPPAPQIRRVN